MHFVPTEQQNTKYHKIQHTNRIQKYKKIMYQKQQRTKYNKIQTYKNTRRSLIVQNTQKYKLQTKIQQNPIIILIVQNS